MQKQASIVHVSSLESLQGNEAASDSAGVDMPPRSRQSPRTVLLVDATTRRRGEADAILAITSSARERTAMSSVVSASDC